MPTCWKCNTEVFPGAVACKACGANQASLARHAAPETDHSARASFAELGRDFGRGFARAMVAITIIIAMLGSAIGFFEFMLVTMSSPSAPQLAAGAASALAWAVIPYCFARLLNDAFKL
jgi:hypothetical protein